MASVPSPSLPLPTPSTVPAPGGAATIGVRALLGLFSAARVVFYGLGTVLLYAGGFVVRAVAWVLSTVYGIVAWPLTRLFNLLGFALSPFTYTFGYLVAPFGYLLRFVLQFKPLYTFLGAGAIAGILAGLAIAYASNYFFVAMKISPADEEDFSDSETSRPSWSSLMSRDGEAKDDVWLWLEEFKPQKMGASESKSAARQSRKQKKPSGLMSMTIVEESSSD